ncbi:MAG: phosphatase PAP2 family protein [Ignavibacteriaceae bacterium]|nr:phosphatase PAP2 family protein [Ignavibacteriaceae bacterium]
MWCIILILFANNINGQSLSEFQSFSNPEKISLSGSAALNQRVMSNYSSYALPNSTLAQASTVSAPDLNLFSHFGNNILDSFKGKNIYLHLAGIASTYILVNEDVDYHVEKYFNEHEEYGKIGRPVVYTGMFLPFVVGGGLYTYAKINKDDETLGASFAVLQASLIEFLYNSTLKAITGRSNPDWRHNTDMDSLSKSFKFGFMRNGIFWGWPSGHTSTTMAVVSALTNYYPDKAWLKVAGYSLVAYTIFGVSSVNRGGMHWFSDAIAATFMSYAIGSTVGKYYRNTYSSRNSTGTNTSAKYSSPPANPIGINLSFQL